MKLNLLILSSAIFLYGCANGGYQKRGIQEHSSLLESVGVEQYLLPELPWWANFSTAGQCFKDKSVRYLDLPRLAQSYGLEYQELISWQVLFNRELTKAATATVASSTPLNDQSMFQQVYGLVKGGVRALNLPAHPTVNIIWAENFHEKTELSTKLKDFTVKPELTEGVPLIVSTCLSTEQLEKSWADNKLPTDGFYFAGSEYFSPFDIQGKARPFFSLNLNSLLPIDTKINLYSTSKELPLDFQGQWTVKNY